MSDSISRRTFLKSSSAVGLSAVALSPVTSVATNPQKVRVIIARDEECIDEKGTKPVKERVQDMVDHSVMALTGKMRKTEAYEALFPSPVTENTRIVMKRNDVSGRGRVNQLVCETFKTGLGNMLDGTFDTGNVTIHCNRKGANTAIDNSDYLINCPVAWSHSTDYGVTLSLKNTMNYHGEPKSLHNKNKKWLHEQSLNPKIKSKQVMSFMDALIGNNRSGPGRGHTFVGYTLIMSRDIVAVDYNAIQLMKSKPNAKTALLTRGEEHLKAAESAGLGTTNPANMEIIEIGPSWKTGIIRDSASLPPTETTNVYVKSGGNRVDFINPHFSSQTSEIVISDMTGKLVWQKNNTGTNNSIVWNSTALNGSLVPSGMYFYRIESGNTRDNGVIMISR